VFTTKENSSHSKINTDDLVLVEGRHIYIYGLNLIVDVRCNRIIIKLVNFKVRKKMPAI
jgi:hypothetical protein